MATVSEQMIFSGVSVEVAFEGKRPTFGDLFCICGEPHPRFPPSGNFNFESLEDLCFSQVDDYFGVRSLGEEGDDVAIWLYPILHGKPAHHSPGPFEAVRIEFCILRNPVRHATHFLQCIERISAFGSSVHYRSRDMSLGQPPHLWRLKQDIDMIVEHWASQGILVGSGAALEVDF